jgi:NhaP-type Na+/H+ and K+/H+ antiporter
MSNQTQKELRMRKIASVVILFTLLTISSVVFVQPASAEDIKMIGAISKIELSADGKSASATLKDTKTGETVAILVTDEQTLDKFKDKRIVEGDEIRCKFEKQDGKNNSKIFKKTAGC